MRPGILIQHARNPAPPPGFVRSDIAGFIGVLGPGGWPDGARAGDFVDIPLTSLQELLEHPQYTSFDAASIEAARQFFENGGAQCRLLGACVRSPTHILEPNPVDNPLGPLIEHLKGEESLGILAMPILAYLRYIVDDRGRVRAQSTPLLRGLLNHCRDVGHRFLIIDPPRDLHDRPLRRWASMLRDRTDLSGAYGALYYPWIVNRETHAPPSGAIAGILARSELTNNPYGVRWPPANAPVLGITHPAVALRWSDIEPLVDTHINPILVQPGRGTVVWGARTLSRDPKWRYINARRIVSAIAEQLRRDAEWLVFERQRPELWQLVERTVRVRLDEVWSGGMLTESDDGLQYLVRCDDELNPPEVRDAGQVHAQVRLRPVGTTEQIIVDLRLGQ
ncbi:MAG: phage tail sheath subtilisin-like domain-containing protein [Myxococcota bacterium]